MANPNDKRSASQRIDDLERGIMSMYQAFDAVSRDLLTAKEAIKVLGNKVEAVVQVSKRGEELSDENIGNQMVSNNVAELKSKVDDLIVRGLLVTGETVEDNSFIVGKEINDAGEVANPRLQFALSALSPELQAKIKGSKAGDVVVVQDGKLKLEVSEVYTIKSPEAPQAPEAPVAETTEEKSETAETQVAAE